MRALAERGLALDETWNKGALQEIDDYAREPGGRCWADPRSVLVSTSSAPSRLQKGLSPGPYISLAGLAVGKQDRAEFERLMKEALAIDPETDQSNRLVIIISQRRARAMLDNIDSLFSREDQIRRSPMSAFDRPCSSSLPSSSPACTCAAAPVTVRLATIVPRNSVWYNALADMGAAWTKSTEAAG